MSKVIFFLILVSFNAFGGQAEFTGRYEVDEWAEFACEYRYGGVKFIQVYDYYCPIVIEMERG